MLKRHLGLIVANIAAIIAAAVPIAAANATQTAPHSFRSAESEALVAHLQRPQETRASRSEPYRISLPSQLLREVGKSLRKAERIHLRQVRAAKARAAARRQAALEAQLAQQANTNPQAYAQQALAVRGWSSQWSCLDALWTRESNWEVHADNSGSGAYGIPQALPASKMATAGADYLSDAATQIRWGLSYIASTYGSPCGALAHSNSYGYY